MKYVKLFEEFTPNVVTCENCGWQWKLQDGGDDVFLCHECNHDNSPKFMNEAKEKAKGDRGPLDNDAIETGLKNKAKESGVPLALLRLVMRRGMDAWNSGHHPGATQEQWGYARVNAFLEKGEGTWQNADKDIAKEVRDGGHDGKLPYKAKD
jgi:hypothetical protein